MGIFDWIFRSESSVEVLDDVIWLTRQAKYAGIQRAIAHCFTNPRPPLAVILVAHFPDCLGQLQQIAADCGQGACVTVTLAEKLESSGASDLPLEASQTIEIIVGERHPLPMRDDCVTDFAGRLECRCRVTFHVSLEDALMQRFAGEWVENLLKQLGMRDDEAIHSKMVARRIRVAQQTIQAQATGDEMSDSAEEWLERNCPS